MRSANILFIMRDQRVEREGQIKGPVDHLSPSWPERTKSGGTPTARIIKREPRQVLFLHFVIWKIHTTNTFCYPTYYIVSVLRTHCKPPLGSVSHWRISISGWLHETCNSRNQRNIPLFVVCYNNCWLS